MKKLRIRKFIVLGLISLVIIAGIFFGRYIINYFSPVEIEKTQQQNKVEIDYPEGWGEKVVEAKDDEMDVLARGENSNTGSLFVLRKIEGSLKKDFDINDLPSELEKTFEKEIEGFKLVESSITTIKSHETVEMRYRQELDDESEIHESLMIIVPTKDQTFYLTFQTDEKSFKDEIDDFYLIAEDFIGEIK